MCKILFDNNLDNMNYDTVIYLDFKNLYFGFKTTKILSNFKYGDLVCNYTGVIYKGKYNEKLITKNIIYRKGIFKHIWFKKIKIVIKEPI